MSTSLAIATVVLALAGPAAIAWLGGRPKAQVDDLRHLLGWQAALSLLTAGCLWLALSPLAMPASSLGLIPPGWSTLVFGGAMAAFFVLFLGPLLLGLSGRLGLAGFEATLGRLARLPLWYLTLAVLIGGAAEEVLYRGVALGILRDLGMTPWTAGTVVVLAFAAGHLPLWGLGPAITTAISGACLTLFYFWHGDLLANAIAHVATDLVGIVLGPLLAARRSGA